MRRHLVLGLSALIALAVATSASAAVRDCQEVAGPTITISSARGMTCKSAQRVMLKYKGSISRTFDVPRGFTCTRVSGGRLAGQWRCSKKGKAFRFEFAD